MSKNNEEPRLNLFRFPPCPICGSDLIMPYGDSKHLECEHFECGFTYEIDRAGAEKVILERGSLDLIQAFARERGRCIKFRDGGILTNGLELVTLAEAKKKFNIVISAKVCGSGILGVAVPLGEDNYAWEPVTFNQRLLCKDIDKEVDKERENVVEDNTKDSQIKYMSYGKVIEVAVKEGKKIKHKYWNSFLNLDEVMTMLQGKTSTTLKLEYFTGDCWEVEE